MKSALAWPIRHSHNAAAEMNLSDMTDSKSLAPDTLQPAPDVRVETDFWRDLVQQIGCEIAGPLTAALDRLLRLTETGSIDRPGLLAMRREIELARQAGMFSQQFARLAAGAVKQTHEKLHLTQTVRQLLTQRQAEVQSRDLQIKPVLRAAEVISDATLLFSLLNAMFDWAFACAQNAIELRIEMRTWPNRARLICRFVPRPAGAAAGDNGEHVVQPVDGLSWRLLKQTARTMGLAIEYQFNADRASVALEFPRTVNSELSGLSAIELDQGFASTHSGAKPLAGSHVLVVASRRDVRIQIREAIRNMGLVVDFVNSVDEAKAFCQEGLPHAIIVESVLRGERFDDMADFISAERPDFVFIEIVEEGSTFEISGFTGTGFARVGRDAILTSLPSALAFELSKAV
jgi:hypothetical protein